LKIPKEQSESVKRRRTDSTMAKRKKNKKTNNDLQNIHIKLNGTMWPIIIKYCYKIIWFHYTYYNSFENYVNCLSMIHITKVVERNLFRCAMRCRKICMWISFSFANKLLECQWELIVSLFLLIDWWVVI
jgi:hypothetical protein